MHDSRFIQPQDASHLAKPPPPPEPREIVLGGGGRALFLAASLVVFVLAWTLGATT